MTSKHCPTEAELVAFADADLSPEQLERIERHLKTCAACSQQIAVLRQLIEDVAAPIPAPRLDVGAHVAAVMGRLDAPVGPVQNVWLLVGGLAGSAAVAAAIALTLSGGSTQEPRQEYFAARGASSAASLSRAIGVQLYARAGELTPLSAGSTIRTNAALTAGVRNSGKAAAYLLLFAVDSRRAVHWIAPEFTLPGSNPPAVTLLPEPAERLLPTSVVFDDLTPGPLRVIALIGAEPARVGELEALDAAELTGERLRQRFPRAEVRELALSVVSEARP